MTVRHNKKTVEIAPHYFVVCHEFRRLKNKLALALRRPASPQGLEIVDGYAALRLWERTLLKRCRRLPSLLRSFSTTILANPCRPTPAQTQQAVIALEQEINKLMALHRQLWQQPLARQLRTGQLLLSVCIEKVAQDLDDLFTFFITKVEQRGDIKLPTRHVWDKEIGCTSEMTHFKRWCTDKGLISFGQRQVQNCLALLREALGGERRRRFCRI